MEEVLYHYSIIFIGQVNGINMDMDVFIKKVEEYFLLHDARILALFFIQNPIKVFLYL